MMDFPFMKKSLLFLLLITTLSLSSQNLVPNPGFDSIISCPVDGQIKYAPPWSFIHNLQEASNNIPALLYNACVPPPGLGVPVSGFGAYQPARSGNGYARVATYGWNNNSVRDDIQAPLLESLKKNQSYYIQFYVSPTNLYREEEYFFTDAVGLAFSERLIDSFLPMFSAPPAVRVAVENRGTLLKDTMNWIKISGCYTAFGDENYVVVGSFVSDQETIFEDQNPQQVPDYARYFIDDIFVVLFDPLPDTILICEGEPKTLNAGFLDASYLWNTGETDSVINIQNAGVYIVAAILDNCTLYDTVVAIEINDQVYFETDTIICQDEPLVLSSPIIGDYLWSTGSEDKDIIVTGEGLYEVTVTNECGQYNIATEVKVENCSCNVYVPNIFSPNADEINDNFKINISCDYLFNVEQFQIFDRWGNQMYKTSEGEEINWDGRLNGSPVQNGVYTWTLAYEVIRNGRTEKFTKTGDVSVL